jgi:hypothetical protein
MREPMAWTGAAVVAGAALWPWWRPELGACLVGVLALCLLAILAQGRGVAWLALFAAAFLLGSGAVQPARLASEADRIQGRVERTMGSEAWVRTAQGRLRLRLPEPARVGERLAAITGPLTAPAVLPGAPANAPDDARSGALPRRARAGPSKRGPAVRPRPGPLRAGTARRPDEGPGHRRPLGRRRVDPRAASPDRHLPPAGDQRPARRAALRHGRRPRLAAAAPAGPDPGLAPGGGAAHPLRGRRRRRLRPLGRRPGLRPAGLGDGRRGRGHLAAGSSPAALDAAGPGCRPGRARRAGAGRRPGLPALFLGGRRDAADRAPLHPPAAAGLAPLAELAGRQPRRHDRGLARHPALCGPALPAALPPLAPGQPGGRALDGGDRRARLAADPGAARRARPAGPWPWATPPSSLEFAG